MRCSAGGRRDRPHRQAAGELFGFVAGFGWSPGAQG